MTEIKIEITRTDFQRIGAEIARQMDGIVAESANAILADAKLAIASPPKTGRIYRRGTIAHQASAPGEAPALDTGNLMGSGFVWENGNADYSVGFTAQYARALEFGTPRILPRPYLRPAVTREEPGFLDAIERAMRSVR